MTSPSVPLSLSVPSLSVQSLLTLADAQNLGIEDCLFLETEVNKLIAKKINDYFSREEHEHFTDLIKQSWFRYELKGLLKIRYGLLVQIDMQNDGEEIYVIEDFPLRISQYSKKGLQVVYTEKSKTMIRKDIVKYAEFLFPVNNATTFSINNLM